MRMGANRRALLRLRRPPISSYQACGNTDDPSCCQRRKMVKIVSLRYQFGENKAGNARFCCNGMQDPYHVFIAQTAGGGHVYSGEHRRVDTITIYCDEYGATLG